MMIIYPMICDDLFGSALPPDFGSDHHSAEIFGLVPWFDIFRTLFARSVSSSMKGNIEGQLNNSDDMDACSPQWLLE